MVNQQLIDYIRRQLAQGYNTQSVRAMLLRSGYLPADIAVAFNYISGPTPQPKKKFNFLIIGIVLVVLVVAAALFLIFFFSGEEEDLVKELRLQITLDENQFESGETISFDLRITNAGQRQEFDIRLESAILDGSGREQQMVEQDLILRESQMTLAATEEIVIPSDLSSGTYTLRSEIFYDSKSAESKKSFFIIEDDVVVVTDVGVGDTTPTVVVLSITELDLERIESIKEIAQSDWVQAKEFCLARLESSEAKDRCLREIALDLNNAQPCVDISDEGEKDTCFFNVARGLEDYSLCAQISKTDLRKTCEMFG
ncbi:hypothetical protein ACFLZB_01620 [Nanoarchaeota archaeon]